MEDDSWISDGAYSTVDVEKVDMTKFKNFRTIPWYHGLMDKGDCLFIPKGWYHTVWSGGNRNLAVNYWFAHLLRFDDGDCRGYEFKENIPLSEKYKTDDHSKRRRKLEEYRSSLFEPFMDLEQINKTHYHIFSDAMESLNGKHKQMFNEVKL